MFFTDPNGKPHLTGNNMPGNDASYNNFSYSEARTISRFGESELLASNPDAVVEQHERLVEEITAALSGANVPQLTPEMQAQLSKNHEQVQQNELSMQSRLASEHGLSAPAA